MIDDVSESAPRTQDWNQAALAPSVTEPADGANRTSDFMSGTAPLPSASPEAAPPVREGDTLPRDFGPYELLAELGRGGMGVVYKARQRSLGRMVALKMIKDTHASSSLALKRFLLEAQAAAGLDHENIVAVHEVGEHAGQHYFTMSYVEGSSLSGLVRGQGPLPPGEAVTLLLAVAGAVEAAHHAGIIHRDLKPDNVLIDRKGRARVTDFGLAKMMEGGPDLTHSGQVLGTPSYMAPEQATGNVAAIGPPTDVYALGGILYFVLTAQPPIRGTTMTQVIYRVMYEAPERLRQSNPDVPEALEAVCLRCLAKTPEERYSSAAEFAEALRLAAAQSGCPTTVPLFFADRRTPSGGSQTASVDCSMETACDSTSIRPYRRGRRVLAVVAAVLLAAAGVAAYRFWPAPGPTVPKADPVATVEFPAPTRHDFALKVEMIGTSADASGIRSLKQGELMRLKIEVAEDAYVGVWTIDPEGQAVMLFPSVKDDDNLFKAGQARVLPGKGYAFPAEIVSTGLEQIRVVASTQRWERPVGEKAGPFQLFATPQQRGEVRGVVMKITGNDPAVAEEALNYRVLPR